ncbi:DegT/DnrJ/EryC1/StrS aminotransferase family protein [Pseudoalteromonas sp. YIC-656]|uniref:DegT/DnrJ/EryC1/StrS family aminotransferase n=1 Tax=Pseudoalteromonas pernae TaxID=3118054 RepID=UPI003242A7B0
MLNTEFSPWPSYTEEEAEAAKRVLLSNKVNYWTGEECRKFEQEFAQFAHSAFAIAVSNGTTALELALNAIGVGHEDEVIVPPRTFLATASAVVTQGGTPVFADVELESGNIDPASIEAAITDKTKAIICVHLAGWPCDMDKIMALAKKHDLYVIEDCAQAHGATYKGKSVGSIGDIGCWSFCQDKIMTTGGEGGMVTTNEKALWQKMWAYKDHGKSYDSVYNKSHPPGFRWLHDSFGTNYRMTEMQAAIGRIQLTRMPQWSEARRENAEQIRAVVSNCELLKDYTPAEESSHAYYKLYFYVDESRLKDGWSRDRIVEAVVSQGVPCYQGSCSEIYLEKAFTNAGFTQPRLPVAKKLGEISLMLLVHPTLTPAEISKTCAVLESVIRDAQI